MNVRRLTSLILLPAWLNACATWQVQTVAPETVLNEDRPEKVQIKTASMPEPIVLDGPFISGDTLYGTAQSVAVAIPLSQVDSLAVKKADSGKAVLSVALVAMLVVGLAVADPQLGPPIHLW
jgi:hypothetical protein